MAIKGWGKSALLRYAFDDDTEKNVLAVFLKPDDLSDLLKVDRAVDINTLIDAWKSGIKQKVADKAVEQMTDGALDRFDSEKVKIGARKITAVIQDAIKLVRPEIHDAIQLKLYENFLDNQKVHIYIDDIDRGWSARPEDITNISALINALKDISSKDSNTRLRTH